ncbi:MAG: hypothetical protein FD155_1612 [Bacteroidetes bacterium]|nr:MAG: hypothetical protein FD155_1612 [Bacteroidota bacterium]
MKHLIIILLLLHFGSVGYSQCCAVGGGSPLAGDASQGVLMAQQAEISSSFQLINTTRFLTGSQSDTNFLDRFSSQYIYTRLAYGVSERLTMSVEAGYWISKKQDGLREADSYSSKGIGDLVLFPKYNVIKPKAANKFSELTLGMGVKIPIGTHNDSIGRLEPFSGEILYSTKPPAVQTTSGGQDLLFSAFYSFGLPGTKLKLTFNGLHILKGWNPLGEKLGNYTSIGVFAGRSYFEKLNVAIQLKGEFIGKMHINPDILMVSFPNYDPEATGSRKLFIAPQLSFKAVNGLFLFAQGEFPLYQYVNKTQIASQWNLTFGITYRFLARSSAALSSIPGIEFKPIKE